MKQKISSEEQAWRQSATNHEFPLQDGDWSAMERLIDGQNDPAAGGLPSGAGSSTALSNRWPFPFFAGILISLLLMAGQAWSGQDETPGLDTPVNIQQPLIADQTTDAQAKPEMATDRYTSAAESASAATPKSTQQSIASTPTRSTNTPNSNTPPPSPPQAYALPDPATQHVPAMIPALQESHEPSRPAVSDFNTLTEAEYTPGLMAFSRLTGKVSTGLAVQSPELPTPVAPDIPTPDRWSFGFLAGARMALPDWPMATTSFGGLAGGFIQYDLSPHWSVRAELAGKLLSRNLQRSDSDLLFDGFGATLKVDQSATTNGLLFFEMPILAVLRQGRHEWFAGPKLALVRVRNDASSLAYSGNAFTEVNSYTIVEGVRRFDAGLTLGYGYRLFHHWGIDLRYNQGLLDLTHDNFFNNTHTLINSDLQLTFRYVF